MGARAVPCYEFAEIRCEYVIFARRAIRDRPYIPYRYMFDKYQFIETKKGPRYSAVPYRYQIACFALSRSSTAMSTVSYRGDVGVSMFSSRMARLRWASSSTF